MSKVDAHLHVWDLERRPQPWTDDLPLLRRSFELDDVRHDQKAADVAGSVLVQCVAAVDETRELLELAGADAAVVGVVGWLDLDHPGYADALTAYQRHRKAPRDNDHRLVVINRLTG
jgi:L-fuconolactonase